MVAAKKTHTTKSAKTTKASQSTRVAKGAHSQKAKKGGRPWTWKFFAVSIGIFLVVVATVIVGAYVISTSVIAQTNQTRLDRIHAIYTSLGLDDSYQVTNTNVFGDKRVYSWDKGRTYSSEIDYIHGDTVSNTATALDTKIKAAGFSFIGEPYPGSKETQYHYKSDKGEYIRLTVESKPYIDALQNSVAMKQQPIDVIDGMDANAGPSKVIIKVNLDDNNE